MKGLIRQRRAGKPGVKRLKIILYDDSPADDLQQVKLLEDWARELPEEGGKLEVELSGINRNAPVD